MRPILNKVQNVKFKAIQLKGNLFTFNIECIITFVCSIKVLLLIRENNLFVSK